MKVMDGVVIWKYEYHVLLTRDTGKENNSSKIAPVSLRSHNRTSTPGDVNNPQKPLLH